MIIFEIFLIDSAFLPNATKVWQSSTTCGYQFYHKIPPPFDITFKIKCNYWYISLMFVWQCIILVQRCKQPTRYNNFRSLIFLNQPYMLRATDSPILRRTFWLYIQFLVQRTDTAADRFHDDTGRQQCRCVVPKAVYTVKKCSWGWANLSPETCRANLKKLINERLLHLVACLLPWYISV